MSAPPVLAAKLSCVSCVSWLIFSSQVFVPFAPLAVKFQQFEYEHEHRDAEHEHEFAPKVTLWFFRGTAARWACLLIVGLPYGCISASTTSRGSKSSDGVRAKKGGTVSRIRLPEFPAPP